MPCTMLCVQMEDTLRLFVCLDHFTLREDFKYNFADFVRKGVVPPPTPLYGQNFRQNRSYEQGGYPPPLL